jgi:4-hydroxyacetophenone monooxygenase
VSVARDNPVSRQELLDASDATIDDAVEHADPIVLRGLLYFLTGDEAIAAIPHSSESRGVLGEVTLLSDPDHVALLRAKTAAWLKSYRDAGGGEVPIARERLRRSMELAAGSPIPDAEIEMWTEQLAIDPMARGFDWPEQPDPTKRAEFLVAVIGTGMAGLNAAVHLKRAGIPFVAIEKNGEVGGTWPPGSTPPAAAIFTASGSTSPAPRPSRCRRIMAAT